MAIFVGLYGGKETLHAKKDHMHGRIAPLS